MAAGRQPTLTCPIGAGGSADKRPEVIAAFVAAEVMAALSQTTEEYRPRGGGNLADRKVGSRPDPTGEEEITGPGHIQKRRPAMQQGGSYSYRIFARNDFSAFWALFTDNLINLIVLSGICQFVFQMPAEIVFGRIVPGAAVAILAGVVVYTWLAKRVAEREGRDVTALPYGISTPVMFVYLFGVIGPIYWSTQDAMFWPGRWALARGSWAASSRASAPLSARSSSGDAAGRACSARFAALRLCSLAPSHWPRFSKTRSWVSRR